MRLPLRLHPDFACPAVAAIEVEIARVGSGMLGLRYHVSGDIGALRLPPPASPVRRDGLWQHTCFEAFAHAPGEAGYVEFNLSPSTEWAAYRFSGYRKGMTDHDAIAAIRIATRSDDGSFVLDAALPLGAGDWQLGLSAVIEDKKGNKSYWALAHPPGKADFHHPDCFAYLFQGPADS